MHLSDIRQEKNSEIRIKEIFRQFKTKGNFLSARPFGGGHIHDTYHVKVSGGSGESYILQKLNNRVFTDIPSLQENIERVTRHIKSKLLDIPGSDLNRECITLIEASGGTTWLKDENGEYWRVLVFIDDHISFEKVEDPAMACEGGKGVGRFLAMLSDFGGEPLHYTIPYFHDIERRLNTFRQKVAEDPAGRVENVRKVISEVEKRAERMCVILRMGKEGILPLRITHNDTKFNNILFDKNKKALCIIDLDTVMPGYIHYDFGDAIRTAANRAAEDEQDLSKVKIDLSIYEAYLKGFLTETKSALTEKEIEYLPFAPQLMTYIQVVRFLTDYIDGDNYFKIHRVNHNLDRARAQLQLVKSMEDNYHDMERILINCRENV